jgi:hypothetical protein
VTGLLVRYVSGNSRKNILPHPNANIVLLSHSCLFTLMKHDTEGNAFDSSYISLQNTQELSERRKHYYKLGKLSYKGYIH